MNMNQANLEPEAQPDPVQRPLGSCIRPRELLTAALMRNQNLEGLIRGFAAEARAFVPIGGVEFVNDEHELQVRDGPVCRHHCRYTLRMRHVTLGQVTFSRMTRFEQNELMSLELLLVELLLPLLGALRTRALAASYPRRTADAVPATSGRHPTAADRAPGSAQDRPTPTPSELALVPLGEDGDFPPTQAEPAPRHGIPQRLQDRGASPAAPERDGRRRLGDAADPLLHWATFGLEPMGRGGNR